MPSHPLRLMPSLLTLATIAILGGAGHFRFSSSYARLRVEALGPRRLQVELSSVPPGLLLDSTETGEAQPKVVVVTPALVLVADSVRTLRIVVQGTAAVRLLLDSASTEPGRSAPIWGRDITLVRQSGGYFQPVPRAHLIP
jgi:hypothetical protein